ncbi:MAG: hypothetical protein K2X39_02270 [Silvanigrellaceae bacterium]|nr:hypothetical protein [Silvanigrellaceae bacterium]
MKKILIILCFFLFQTVYASTFTLLPTVSDTATEEEKKTSDAIFLMSSVDIESHTFISKAQDQPEVRVLQPFLVKFGETFIIQLREVKGVQTLFSQKIKISDISEMDIASVRILKAVLNHQEMNAPSVKLGEITQAEEKLGTTKRMAQRYWGVAIAPTYLLSGKTSERLMFGFDLSYRAEVNQYNSVGVFFETFNAINGDQYITSFGLSIDHAFLPEDFSPFISLRLGYGAARLYDKSKSAFVGDFLAGYRLFRTSNVQFEAGGKYTIFMDQIKGELPHALGIYGLISF